MMIAGRRNVMENVPRVSVHQKSKANVVMIFSNALTMDVVSQGAEVTKTVTMIQVVHIAKGKCKMN